MKFNINTDEAVKFTNKLEKLHRLALPNAIRSALNNTVFDVKTNTMPRSAANTFEKRQPNFFKANSRFEKATGFNIKSMKATVGFIDNNLKGGNNYAVKDLEEQEHGGRINKKSFIPFNSARVGKNYRKNVKPMNRFRKIKFIDAGKVSGKSIGQKFNKAVFKAGVGGNVLGSYKGKQIVWRVEALSKNKNRAFKLTPIYSYEKGRTVSVKQTSFMKEASLESNKKMESFYIKEAERQIAKLK